MRVMVVVPSFNRVSPVLGAFLFVNFLKRKNIDVLFVSIESHTKNGESIIDLIEENGIAYRCLNIPGWKGMFTKGHRFRKFCIKEKPSVVLSYLLRPNLLVWLFSPVKSVAYVRGILKQDYRLAYGIILSEIIFRTENLALKKMDKVFSLTEDMADYLQTCGVRPRRIVTIPNCIDVESFREFRSTAKAPGADPIRMGIFCSLIPRKDVATAVQGFGILTTRIRRPVELHISGDGACRAELERMVKSENIQDKVIFHGHLKDPLNLMANMSLVLLSSKSEGLPRCLMEAMALGKTVVASDIPGIRELVKHGKTGYLFPVGNPEAMALVLENIIEKEKYVDRHALISFMMGNHDVTVQSERMLNELNRLIEISQ